MYVESIFRLDYQFKMSWATLNTVCVYILRREKKRRKAGGDTAKPERTYISTVLMTSCLVLAFPYDLPPFLPALVTSLVKHATVPAVQDVVTKTVQSFKRTHQDRCDAMRFCCSFVSSYRDVVLCVAWMLWQVGGFQKELHSRAARGPSRSGRSALLFLSALVRRC